MFSRSISATAERTVMVSLPESLEESMPSVADAVLLSGNVVEHPHELRPAGDALAGLSGVAVLPGDLHVLEVRVFLNGVLLCLEAVAVDLHLRGDANVGVAFCLLSVHFSSSPRTASSGTMRKYFNASRI